MYVKHKKDNCIIPWESQSYLIKPAQQSIPNEGYVKTVHALNRSLLRTLWRSVGYRNPIEKKLKAQLHHQRTLQVFLFMFGKQTVQMTFFSSGLTNLMYNSAKGRSWHSYYGHVWRFCIFFWTVITGQFFYELFKCSKVALALPSVIMCPIWEDG